MSPEMLTLVAEVLAYDLALEMCDRLSSIVDVEETPRAMRRASFASLNDRSCTRLEKDMVDSKNGDSGKMPATRSTWDSLWRSERS